MPAFTVVTLFLLAGAICAVWAPAVGAGRLKIAPWVVLALAAAGCGLLAGVLQVAGLAALLALAGAAALSASHPRYAVRLVAGVVTAVLALALATHRLPGFDNPLLLQGVVLSNGAAPFTQYANLDKGAVGLILLALLCQRLHSWLDAGAMLRRAWPVMAITLVAVFGAALGLGLVRPEFKLSALTLQFIAVNLFFTVVAEEAFFRSLLQQPLSTALARFSAGKWLALVVSALLFGAVHLGGGPLYALLALIAGLGYAWVYQRTGRIEAAIVLHIVVNALHFIAFTYPYLLKAPGA
ncbi:MAG: CPBP family intramembrane glutamic endopeptidase [Duganella sp.]